MSWWSKAPIVGALYAYRGDDRRYGILKILALTKGAVHVRLYVERFEKPPKHVSSSELTLGSISDADFGIGHMPLNAKGFGKGHILVGREEVHEEELDGYRIWEAQDAN
jgi:hypothetical protein